MKRIALDCEMIGDVNDHSMLARVSLVDYNGNVIYDTYVKPTRTVGTYRTEFHGITGKDLEKGKDFKLVQKEVINLINGSLLIGHSVPGDLKVLEIQHPSQHIRDIAEFSQFRSRGQKRSLKDLARDFLGEDIQTGYHDSVEDAKTTMKLYKKIEHMYL